VNRPFEVGCMVVSNKYGIGVVTELNTTFYKYVECKFESKRIDFSLRGYETFEDERCTIEEHKTEMLNSVITAIRKPRKGSKEARDIVLDLALDLAKARREHHRYYKANGWNHKFKVMEKQHEPTIELRNRFERAKAKLGVLNG